MPHHRFTRTLAALVAAGVLASCGESSLLDDYDATDGTREQRAAAKARTGSEKARGTQQRAGTEKRRAERARAAVSRTAPGAEAEPRDKGRRDSAARTSGAAGEGTAATRAARSCTDDLAGDMDGTRSAPSYADLTGGCVEESGDRLVLTATTAGAIPDRMPDRGSNLAVGFELGTGGKPWYVAAEANSSGWSAYASRGRERRSLPAPTISGSRLTLSIPASQLGAGSVRWLVESSWLRSTLTSTSYSFDDAPNGRTATLRR